ncbi:unnamed protein product [Adineta ricciae]|uniref:Uncharacterized protein n=1 Tax=Adineta ricciae TaxID=249248 RepID=A0A814MHL4_ADIRI|nr:unnamed protein product [Adineta ricciae]CAF1363348.1 unnamed protein product [Adineta ricciae]
MPSNDASRTTVERLSEQRMLSLIHHYWKIILIVIAGLIFLLLVIVVFSIYFARNVSITTTTIDINLNTTTIKATSFMSSTTSKQHCNAEFERISTKISCLERKVSAFHIASGDFNNDNRTDLVYACKFPKYEKIVISLNHRNGTFQNSMRFSLPNSDWIQSIHVADLNNDEQSDALLIHGAELQKSLTILLGNGSGMFHYSTITLFQSRAISIKMGDVADFNNDDRIDVLLVFQYNEKVRIAVLFGNGDGTFQTQMIALFVEISGLPRKIRVDDLNNDKILDIVINFGNDDICTLFGYPNGTFSSEVFLFKQNTVRIFDFSVSDVNNDKELDIIASDEKSKHMYALFGNGNGAFQKQKPFFGSIVALNPLILINDFDHDNQPDIAFFYVWKYTHCLVYHYQNNTFKLKGKTVLESRGFVHSVVAHDIDVDSHLDIILVMSEPSNIYILFGYGNATFYSQMIYSATVEHYPNWLVVTHSNQDHYPDLIHVGYETQLIDVFMYEHDCSIV